MRSIDTRGRTRAELAVLARTRSSQAATMTLLPGAESTEGSANTDDGEPLPARARAARRRRRAG